MADNYLQFSEVIPHLTQEEEAWLRNQLQTVAVHNGNEVEIDDPDSDVARGAEWTGARFLRDNGDYDPSYHELGFDFEFVDGNQCQPCWGRHLWLYAEEYGVPVAPAWLVHKFLKRFRPDQCWSLTFATTCSKLRVGEFGGGAMFVTADLIRWHSSHRFVEEERSAFEAANKEQPPTPNAGVNTGGGRYDNE